MQNEVDFFGECGATRYRTILADPPWRFRNRTGRVSPEYGGRFRYRTMALDEIATMPVAQIAETPAHLYLWVPNALLAEGLAVMRAWGFDYKTNVVWHKVRKVGGPDGRGTGFYFRNTTEILLFGVRGKKARTLPPGRSQVNVIRSRRTVHSRKPAEQYALVESCSPAPFIELFARGSRDGWASWGDEAERPIRSA